MPMDSLVPVGNPWLKSIMSKKVLFILVEIMGLSQLSCLPGLCAERDVCRRLSLINSNCMT